MVLVPMQRARDCGIAALATHLQVSYGDASDAVLLALGQRLGAGVYNETLIRAAKLLNRRLKRKRTFDVATAEGILGVEAPRIDHFVVLLGEGQVYDPEDNSLWEVDDYVAAYGIVKTTLLV